jgi:hypothetical protein
MTKTLLASAVLLSLMSAAQADISVTSSAFSYSESFDTLTTATAATAWVNDSTLAGWSLIVSNGNAAPTYAADAGASNAGTFRSFGDAGSGERALGSTASGGTYFGSPASGAVAGWIAVALNNASGGALPGFTLSYSGEQWRNGGNTNAQSLTLEYGFGASFAAVGAWTPAGAGFNFSSPVVGATAGAVAGNSTGTVTGLGGTVLTPWAAGDTLWLRWADANDVGNDHGLGIDNVSIGVASVVPEPGSLALLMAGVAAVGFMVRRQRA